MSTFHNYEQQRDYLLNMIEKGRLQSLAQAARLFSCSTDTIGRMIYDLRINKQYNIHYSRSMARYVLLSGPYKK